MELPLLEHIRHKPKSLETLLRAFLSCEIPDRIPATVIVQLEQSVVCNNGHRLLIGWIGDPKIVIPDIVLRINSDQCPECQQIKQYDF